MTPTAYMSVAEVSAELGISTSGVYKLIQREKLAAIRRTERGIVVPRIALDAYRRRLEHGPPAPPPLVMEHVDLETRVQSFRDATGTEPEEWMEAWKADRIEDSAENMRHMIRALGILADRKDQGAPAHAGSAR